ncbi:MAG TPA: hypothetical protein VK430_09875 [Xanthobacteraceae bacterium]|nr:hypothetical protein [Xanthobacteraceae bacterium]
MVINAILDQAMKTGGKNAVMAGFPVTGIAAGALVLALILTPLFCWYVREEGDAVVSGLISPRARRPKRRKGQESVPKEGPRLVEALTA